ncbi:hypothetical protein B9J78_04115 [bacterium Unc6]|nr:hypothetical protein [bacterium Unc6]
MKEYLGQIIKEQPNILLKRSAVIEYLQARLLQSLQDSKAFLSLAFVGGTALRFLYSLPRYSEDLDFSLVLPEKIDFNKFLYRIRKDFEAENYKIFIKTKQEKPVISAFIRFQGLLYELNLSPLRDEVLSVKIEIDINPPEGGTTTTTLFRRYVMLNVLHYDKSSLFAGKLHAILARKYTKGRDIFDLVWMFADSSWTVPNFVLLNNALQQTKWKGQKINNKNWKSILLKHIKNINWKVVVNDAAPFLEREGDRKILTRKNFLSLTS